MKIGEVLRDGAKQEKENLYHPGFSVPFGLYRVRNFKMLKKEVKNNDKAAEKDAAERKAHGPAVHHFGTGAGVL